MPSITPLPPPQGGEYPVHLSTKSKPQSAKEEQHLSQIDKTIQDLGIDTQGFGTVVLEDTQPEAIKPQTIEANVKIGAPKEKFVFTTKIKELFKAILVPKEKASKPEKPRTLDGYLEITGDSSKEQQIKGLVALGKKAIDFFAPHDDMESISLNDEEVHASPWAHLGLKDTPENREKVATAIIWALMDEGITRGQSFTNGSFVIEDKGGKLYEFLSKLPETYDRRSSHLQKFEGGAKWVKRHKGLDLPPTADWKLPFDKAHLLFHSTKVGDKQVLFIKPEEHGTKGAAIIGHAHGLYQSIGRRVLPSIFGSNQGDFFRKERIPPKLLKEFNKLVDASGLDRNERKHLKSEAKREGVGKMYTIAKDKGWADFANKLSKAYDHVKERIGEEIYFTHDDLKNLNSPAHDTEFTI